MIKTSKSALQRLKEQRTIIDARIQATESRLKQTQRKQDTRRKILVGSYYLDNAITENKMDELKKIMDKFLTRDSDRKLFDIPATPNKEKQNV